jgi:hypothetical protein
MNEGFTVYSFDLFVLSSKMTMTTIRTNANVMVYTQRDSVRRFLALGFFHQWIHPRALIHGLMPFRIWLWIRREILDIRLKWSASAVSMRSRKRIRQFEWDHRSGFSGFNETVEVDLAFLLRLRKRLPRFKWASGITKKGSFQHKTMSKKVLIRWF